MKTKNWWLVVVACLLLIAIYEVSYTARYSAGENSAESKLREEELAFQKEKEANRLRIYKEEKQAEEKRRREDKIEKTNMEIAKLLSDSMDRQHETNMKMAENILQIRGNQPRVSDQFINDYLEVIAKTTPTGTQITVTGISYNPDNPAAVIDGYVVHEGDILQGIKIIKIRKGKVKFEKNGNTWTQGIGYEEKVSEPNSPPRMSNIEKTYFDFLDPVSYKSKITNMSSASQWAVFETTTIDGWVKKIKRGTIFKTTSGNIYEVAEAVFLFKMKLRPKVTALTNGQIYKLLIEGIDEQLLCKKLSPTKAYINTGEHHWISENIDSGTFIKLEDDSLWEVSPIDKIYSMLWLSTSSITVIEGKNPLYPYLLINTDDGEQVEAQLLSD